MSSSSYTCKANDPQQQVRLRRRVLHRQLRAAHPPLACVLEQTWMPMLWKRLRNQEKVESILQPHVRHRHRVLQIASPPMNTQKHCNGSINCIEECPRRLTMQSPPFAVASCIVSWTLYSHCCPAIDDAHLKSSKFRHSVAFPQHQIGCSCHIRCHQLCTAHSLLACSEQMSSYEVQTPHGRSQHSSGSCHCILTCRSSLSNKSLSGHSRAESSCDT